MEGVNTATSIAETFVGSSAKLLLMECQPCLTRSEDWHNLVLPRLEKEACRVETAVVNAGSVGVPSSKLRIFVVRVKSYGPDGTEEKLRT